MTRAKDRLSITWRLVCRVCQLAYSTLMRWRNRLRRGKPILLVPGPRKKDALERRTLDDQIARLDPGTHRTHGSGALYAQVKDAISRREFQAMVNETREQTNHALRAAWTHVEWLYGGVAWAMDDAYLGRAADGRKVYAHNGCDLAARYLVEHFTGFAITGDSVAESLSRTFDRDGLPLILKRDNGANLNENTIERLLAEKWVISLNNPPYCSRYNGGIERMNRELKKYLRAEVGTRRPSFERWSDYVAWGAEMLNHKAREVLGGKTPCECFHDPSRRISFTLRERYAIFNDVARMVAGIYRRLEDKTERGRRTAYRLAVETWLKKEKLIVVTKGVKVLPNFPAEVSH